MGSRPCVSPVSPKPEDASQMGETLVLGTWVGEGSIKGETGRKLFLSLGSFVQSWVRLVETQ